jgi:predicted GIY-YIG superfamily endonuclease
MKICGIYEIRNSVNGKRYVGGSADINKRIRAHLLRLRKKLHGNHELQSDFNKYGEKMFGYGVLEKCSENMLAARENHWITSCKSTQKEHGYNIKKVLPTGRYERGLLRPHNGMVSITVLLPKSWLKLIDEDAARQVTNRSQIIRSRLQDSCLRTPAGT